MGLRTFPGKFLVRVWSLVAIRGEMSKQHDQTEPVHNTVTMYACGAKSFFCTFECSYSSVLRRILVKLHILTRLVESFPMVYRLWRCIEVRFVNPSRSPCLKTVHRKSFECGNFLVLCPVPLKIAYFNSANRELSNGVQVMELYWNRNVYLSRSPCLKIVYGKRLERHNLVLHPVLLKIAYFSSANRELSNDVRLVELR